MQPDQSDGHLHLMLTQGAVDLGLSLTESQVATLLAYVGMMGRWNRVYNLTALRQPADMLTHHVLDSLAVVSPLQKYMGASGLNAPRLLDVGSGAGLPGVVLAVAMPTLAVTCIDTVGKKASFVQQVAAELGLVNLRSQHARVEQWSGPADGRPFDVITSRAFSSLSDFVQLTRHHLSPQGVWMAMKGKRPDDEQQILPNDVLTFHVEPLQVPRLDAERCLVWMKKA